MTALAHDFAGLISPFHRSSPQAAGRLIRCRVLEAILEAIDFTSFPTAFLGAIEKRLLMFNAWKLTPDLPRLDLRRENPY